MPDIPRQQDEPATTDEEIWMEASHRLKLAIEAEGNNRTEAIQALEFLDGQQWPDDLYNQRKINKRPSLTINMTRTFRMRVVNNMKDQRPRIKVHPVGDGADVDKAEVVGGIIRHIEQRSNAGVAYDIGGASAVDIGWGYWRILSEYIDPESFDQELVIQPIRNAFTVYMDPNAVMPAGEDQDWCIITEKMSRQEYKRLYPKAKDYEYVKGGAGDFQGLWEGKTWIRLAEYYRITRKTDTLHRLSNGMTVYESERKQLKADMAAAQATVVESRPSYRRMVEWYKLNGQDIVDRRPQKGEYIPVIRCEGNVLDVNGIVKRKGMIADLMDPARMFNYWRTAETEQLALSSKAPWVGAEGFRDGHPEWNNANQTPYSALEYNVVTIEQPDGTKVPLPPPARQPAIEVPAGFVQAAQSAQQDIMAVAGMPHDPGQDTPGSVVSGVALRRRQALSDIGHFQYYDNQTRAIAHTGRILLDLIPYYYSTQRMQRIIGDDGTPTMKPLNQPDPATQSVKNDMTVGRYDVVMDTGPGYDTKRQEGAEAMVDLLKITPLAEIVAKSGADLVFRALDAPYMQELADRVMPQSPEGMKKIVEQLPKQAQGVVQSLIANLNAATQKISQLEADVKFGLTKTMHQDATKLQIETMKDKRAEKDTSTDAQTKVFDTHVKSVTARDVAEINAGAKLMDTHKKGEQADIARHDELAAAERAEKSKIN